MSDYIDRQEAIDAIHEWGLIDGLSEGQAIEILSDEEKVPSVQPQMWIPVTEALPEYDFTDVLICLHDVRHGCEDDYYIIQAYTVRGHWKPTLDINIDDLDVVAWMPLPPVYEGGQDE